MLKLKYILNDLVEYAYKGDEKLTQYKRFYVEYLKKRVSFSEIESPSLLFRRGRTSLLRKRKSNLVQIQQAHHPSRRMRWWRPAS